MIGINKYGDLKIWCNENWAKNHPEQERTFVNAINSNEEVMENSNEQEMVRNIIDVIEERCEEGRYPPEFRTKIQSQPSFLAA